MNNIIEDKAREAFTMPLNKRGEEMTIPIGQSKPHGWRKFLNAFTKGYNSALSQPPVIDIKDKTVWLIENENQEWFYPNFYWAEFSGQNIGAMKTCWTKDANNALHFNTKKEAADFADDYTRFESEPVIVTEHIFTPYLSTDSIDKEIESLGIEYARRMASLKMTIDEKDKEIAELKAELKNSEDAHDITLEKLITLDNTDGIIDNFVNELFKELEKLKIDTSNCDGDESPAFIIARWFAGILSERDDTISSLTSKLSDMEKANEGLLPEIAKLLDESRYLTSENQRLNDLINNNPF